MNRISRLAVGAGALAAIVQVAAGCATLAPSEAAGAGQGAVLSKQYGGCATSLGDIEPAGSYLAGLTPWRQVVAIRGTERSDDHPGSALLEVAYTDADGKDRTALLGESALEGVRWGLGNKADVWLGIEPLVAYEFENVGTAVVVTADDLFFPGDCGDQMFYRPVHSLFGTGARAKMLEVVHGTPQRAQALLDPDVPEGSPTDQPVILNPETAPQELLESLRVATLHLSSTDGDALDDTTSICTHIAEGWNDCAPSSMLRDGVTLGGYVGDVGSLEFWLMDANATLTSPLGYLGSIDVGKTPHPQARVTIDMNGLDPEALPQTADEGVESRVRIEPDN
ncbi:hypothetical protein [Cellulomonas edaphi]|uniref:Uncharacterized protein n=1 Tax=Cellulomonas edaphi TaxID=3053468 RepID=A0ABT7SAB7_9CELL|nr:hypothetical protein [Cellulomons edaphi]MDM7831904.1 hypothetical protein [Cellulomons edaphi]